MYRHGCEPRSDWRRRCEEVGFAFHTINGERYWNEGFAYEFSLDQVEIIEAAAEELHQRCLDLVDWIVQHQRFERFELSDRAKTAICRSWSRQDPSLYGRFDFAWDGRSHAPKLLEYNADTPTGLIEASVAQWFWLKDLDLDADQFNSIHEKLIERWKILPAGTPVHFSAIAGHDEDTDTTRYLMDTALQAGLDARFLTIDEIGLHHGSNTFVDLDGQRIEHLFKLYPWEWMWRDDFADQIEASDTRFLEPPWKLLLSSKAMLPLLWERNSQHRNLLPASFADTLGRPVVCKPIYSREGANIQLLGAGGAPLRTAGPYDHEPTIFQAASPLPRFDDVYAVIGAWVVGDQAAGLGMREDNSPITRNTSHFVPHFFRHPT